MISLPSKPKIVKKEKDDEAVFEINSLYPGYGVTVGNSLRRVLLSSLSGAAVTKVKITDVNHEFSTIPGVMEDVISIILNLKELRFRVHSDEPQVARLKVKGEMDVKGSHFTVPTQIELVNPDVHIATLTDKKASLDMEIEIEKGMGYSSAEDRKEEKLEVGQIIIDSIFTPVKRVNFHVENMRVGKRTDYDRLFIEIETDKTISPEDAFFNAVEILKNHFERISSFEEEKEEKVEKEKKEEKKKEEPKEEDKEIEELSVEEIGISTRTANILKDSGIKKVKQLIKKRESAIAELSGMGEKGIEEIKKALKKKKLQLKEEK
jgi:DNA-directed RNA polymerase subunit alpha